MEPDGFIPVQIDVQAAERVLITVIVSTVPARIKRHHRDPLFIPQIVVIGNDDVSPAVGHHRFNAAENIKLAVVIDRRHLHHFIRAAAGRGNGCAQDSVIEKNRAYVCVLDFEAVFVYEFQFPVLLPVFQDPIMGMGVDHFISIITSAVDLVSHLEQQQDPPVCHDRIGDQLPVLLPPVLVVVAVLPFLKDLVRVEHRLRLDAVGLQRANDLRFHIIGVTKDFKSLPS